MPAIILGGREVADSIKDEVRREVESLDKTHGFRPGLTVVRVGEDPASNVYVTNKVKTSKELGIVSEHTHLPESTSQEDLLEVVRSLNERENVDGILVQLPLPKQIDADEILNSIDPAKDVDGFHPVNVGRLHSGQPSLVPCTPAGVVEMIKRSGIEIAGKHAVVVGRSNIVGKPMAALLLRENATVTICHSRTADLPSITTQADILIAAIGKAGFIRGNHIRKGAAVFDVGINNLEDRDLVEAFFPEEDCDKRRAAIEKRGYTLCGDVNAKEAIEKAGHFTPVPGGVGLLTVAMLMKNTVVAARSRRGI